MTLVKVCGITNLNDALAAVGAGADWLGFNFYEGSPRYIAPRDAHQIIEQLPQTVVSVGIFVNEEAPDEVARKAKEAHVAAVQLHGDESTAYCQSLNHLFVIKALRVGKEWKPESALRYKTEAVLLDAYQMGARGGTGHTFDWSLAQQAQKLTPKMFLAGGLTPGNVGEAITAVRPFGVDVCSGVEVKPGVKDVRRMKAFVQAVRAVEILEVADKP